VRFYALAVSLIIPLLTFSEGHALKVGGWGGVVRLAGDEISDSDLGYRLGVGFSHTVVDGVDYELGFHYAKTTANDGDTYVKKSVELSSVWYPGWSPLLPYAKGHIGFHNWQIEENGGIALHPETGEEMKARSLGLGAGVGGRWEMTSRLEVDISVSARLIFTQDGLKFGPTDRNEVYLESSLGLWYRLF
jgi:hypothetical protein